MATNTRRKPAARPVASSINGGMMLLAGAGAGLALMYLLDPQAGAKRRHAIMESAHDALSKARTGAGDFSHSMYDAVRARLSAAGNKASEHVHDHVAMANEMIDNAKHRANVALGRESDHHYVGQAACALGSMALGAALVWIFDPQLGRSRRARLMDKTVHYANEVTDMAGRTGRHMLNRMRGKVAMSRRFIRDHMPETESAAADQPAAPSI